MRASRIVHNLLTFARQHKAERTSTDLNEVVQLCYWRPMLQAFAVPFTFCYGTRTWMYGWIAGVAPPRWGPEVYTQTLVSCMLR